MKRAPRVSLKKHDAAEDMRASKARRDRTTTQVRKDKRRQTVQTKRRRVMPTETADGAVPAPSGRDIKELVKLLSATTSASASSHQERLQALKEIRVMLSAHTHDYEAAEKIIESGIVGVMVNLLNAASQLATTTRSGGEIYQEILWCLTNIASGQYEHTKLVLPAVPRLLQFLEGSNHTLAEHAAWVLGNIAADCEEFRQQLIANGAIVPLLKQVAKAPTEPELAQNSAWALSNIARGHETSALPFLQAGIIPVLATGLQKGTRDSFNEDIVVEVAWLLSFLTAREEECLRALLESGLLQWLVPNFATTNELVLTPILRVFGNVCCGSIDHHTDEWQRPYITQLLQSDAGFLAKLHEFLQQDVAATHAHLASESAWVLSNLAALDATVVQTLVDAEFLQLLATHLQGGTFEVRREAAFAITNIALTSPALMDRVLSLNVLKVFLSLLTAADIAVVGNSLRFIENVLRTSARGVALVEADGGIDALETVQFQSSEPHLATWAEALVNEFYGENYGVMSPTSSGAPGGVLPTLPSLNASTANAAAAPFSFASPTGRGRGSHMTTPAWKK